MFKVERLFYIKYSDLNSKLVTEKELLTLVYRVYTANSSYVTLRFLENALYNVFVDKGYYSFKKFSYLECIEVLNKINSGDLGIPKRRLYPISFPSNHKGYRWKTAHYIGRVKLYTELSTLGISYRHQNRDAGMKSKYQSIGDDWDFQVGYSTGWKHLKKRHQWE